MKKLMVFAAVALAAAIGSSDAFCRIRDIESQNNAQTPVAQRLPLSEGMKFIDFKIVQDPDDSANSTVRFSDYVGKGKYILVDFWASWCGPCKAEIPNIRNVHRKYAGDDFDVLSIAVWDKPEDTKRAALEHGIIWKQIINAGHIPTDLYGIQGIPYIILIGPDGAVLKMNLRGDAIEREVSKYVKIK